MRWVPDFCYASYLIMTRKLAGTAPPVVTLAFTALLGTIVMSVWIAPRFVVPSSTDLGLMVAVGGLAAVGHYLFIMAMERAPASLLAPYGYSEIITATILGHIVFADFPDRWTWVGIAIVIGSGLYISLRERHLAGMDEN